MKEVLARGAAKDRKRLWVGVWAWVCEVAGFGAAGPCVEGFCVVGLRAQHK